MTDIKAFAVQRPVTNLVNDSTYSLASENKKSGFLGLFNKAYPGDARKTFVKVALGSIMDMGVLPIDRPARAKSQEERLTKRLATNSLNLWETKRAEDQLAFYTRLKKVNQGENSYFLLSLPVLKLSSPASVAAALSALGGASSVPIEAAEYLSGLTPGSHFVDIAHCLENAKGIAVSATDLFRASCENVEISVSEKKDTWILYLTLKVPAASAEYLVNTDWVSIRPVDLYPLFTMWVHAEYNQRYYGKTSFPLSRISSTLPAHDVADERVDKYNISINMSGDPLWLPTPCDNTSKYEQQYAAVGDRENFFQLLDENSEGHLRQKLPANIPILTDWVNFKFTYSNTSGKPESISLEHFRKCTNSMAMNILSKEANEKELTSWAVWARHVDMQLVYSMEGIPLPHNLEEKRQAEGVFMISPGGKAHYNDYVKRAYLELGKAGIVPRYLDMCEGGAYILQPIHMFLKKLYAASLKNIDVLYSVYAVKTVTEKMGILAVLAEYGGNLTAVATEANTTRQVYEYQGMDPNWIQPALPLVSEKLGTLDGGFLPHQARIRNELRDSPDLVVMPVSAGGGKSLLAITDVLQEISRGASGPFLIMCPSFLVANYVSEIVEFTDGKLNCIPVTTYNVKTTGMARYEEILKSAPINSVFVVDFNVVRFRPHKTVYGTSATTVYPVVELIRRFKPQYVFIDEVHLLKNAKSSKFKAVMSLVADIQKKRIASGTLNPDSPSDLPGQLAFLDPTVLGSRDDFNTKYALAVKGNRVLKWRTKGENSLTSAMRLVKGNMAWCAAKRKEWACALPRRIDTFIPCDLTPNQHLVYDAIFDDMVKQIRKQAETDKAARALLDKLEGKKASEEDEDQFGGMESEEVSDDLDDDGDPGPSLQPYLADIERFLTNPIGHNYARNGFVNAQNIHVAPLSGVDMVAPKIAKLIDRMKNVYGTLDPARPKTLVFVNYNESAKAVFEAMPPELKACGILYSASDKTALINKFKTNDKIRWMVGIRQSLEVGLNLQKAGYLTRVEGVWTPGEQEQGDSRIARPDFSPGGDKRSELRFDTLVINQSLDITKAARLRAKVIAVAKFENIGNPAYESIEDMPVIPLTLANIVTQNDFESNLASYAESMRRLNQVMEEENAEYREKILKEGGLHLTQIPAAATPPGSALLARVPYAQGTELYKASELGLVRVDNYLGMDLSHEEDGNESEDDSEESEANSSQRDQIMGLRCHTEQGDGYISGGSGNPIKRVRVACDDGTTIRVSATAAFIATRTETNGIDLRTKLAEASGLDISDKEITVPSASAKVTRVTKKMEKEQEAKEEAERKAAKVKERALKKSKLSISLHLGLVNGYMKVSFDAGKNPAAAKAMEALGFVADPAYYYTQIRSYKQLVTQANNWATGGFEITRQVDNDTFQILTNEFVNGGLRTHKDYARVTTAGQFKNYMRGAWKPSADKKLLNMFALVTDGGNSNPFNLKQANAMSERTGEDVIPNFGVAYLCLPAGGGHPASRLATAAKYKAPGTKWVLSKPILAKFVGSLNGVHQVIELIREAGISIDNIDTLNKIAKSVKKITPKTDESVFYKLGTETPDEPQEETKPIKKKGK
jgi:hypothetical protein